MLNITQEDYSVLKQPIIQRYMKLELLDFDYNVRDELSGVLLSFNINIDANSDTRRTCNVSFVVTDSSFDIKDGGKIWLDRYIRPYIGTYDIKADEIIWRNQGIYLINQPSREYDNATNVLSIQGVDLTAKMTGMRNGQLEGMTHVITAGSNVRQAIIAVIALAGFTKYEISECYNRDGTVQDVPYDIEVAAGGTVWNLLTELRDILPQYQMYFDIDGVFHYDLIPSGEDEVAIIDDDLLTYLLLSENTSTDFEAVKNYVEIYGAIHDVQHYPTEMTVSNSTINMTIPSLTSAPEAGDMIGWAFESNTTVNNAKINVNSTTARNLVDSNGDIVSYTFNADEYYVAIYQDDDTWFFLGHQQAQAMSYDDNPESPFYIEGSVGRIRFVGTGGEYDNIQTDELAQARANIEIYWRSRLNDSISLIVIPIPWLDVNMLMSYTLSNSTEKEQWMIDSINADYSETGTMSITAHKYYPFYPPY